MKIGILGKIILAFGLSALLGGVAPAAENSSRLHWLGKRQIGAETNAAKFMALWNLPESAKLEAQFLDKLAGATNAASKADARLRTLLEDVLREEFYAEVRYDSNQPAQAVFAIRLNAERAKLWEAGRAVLPPGVEMQRAGDWTLLGQATGANALLAEWRERIAKAGAPGVRGATNFWVEADVDLPAVARALGWRLELPAGWPRTAFTMIGDGVSVWTRGTLDFAKPLNLPLEAWNIPTNFIREPLVNFTAVRGVKPWLASLKLWQDLKLGEPPGQLFFWSLQGMPVQSYFAAPLGGAETRVKQLSQRLLAGGNEWLKTNGSGHFVAETSGNGVTWDGVPFALPYLKSAPGGFLAAGLFSEAPAGRFVSGLMVRDILSRSNLVCYDRENTGARLDGWLHAGQLFRVVLRAAQLPPTVNAIAWFQALSPRLGDSTTIVDQAGPVRLTFARQSGCGFTALELHLLADWLESPDFPAGLHSFRAPPDIGGPRKKSMKAPPAPGISPNPPTP